MTTNVHGLELSGDVTSADWVDFFNASHADLSRRARELKEATRLRLSQESVDRCQVVAADFNTRTLRPDGTHDPFHTENFYAGAVYDSMLALEMPEEGFLVNSIEAVMTGNWEGEMNQALASNTEDIFRTRDLNYFIHGFGHGQLMLGIAAINPDAAFYACDIFSPTRLFIIRMMQKYVRNLRLEPVWVLPGDPVMEQGGKRLPHYDGVRFHAVHSCEVLEHVHEPARVLRSLVDRMHVGGLAMVSTFFNSMNGHDPQHLTENEHYQDSDLWYAELDEMGLRKFWYDPRGVPKIWQKVQAG